MLEPVVARYWDKTLRRSFRGDAAFASPEAVKQWSLTTLREKLIKIGSKIVRHGRYVMFQMAEVAIPRTLFADILCLVDRLRPKPAPARQTESC